MSSVIEEVKVRNFEGYREAEFKFAAGLNLIVGRNATGKSSVLDAISFALFGDAQDVKPRLLVSRLQGSRDMEVYIKFKSPRTQDVAEIFRRGKLDPKGGYKTEVRTLVINGKEMTLESDEELREKVTGLLGTSFKKFLSLVYVKQGKLTSILQPDRDQMDAVLGITLLRELRDQLKETSETLSQYEGRDAATEASNLESLTIPQLTSVLEHLAEDIPPIREEAERLGEQVTKGESPELARLVTKSKEKRRNEEERKSLQVKAAETLRRTAVGTMEELAAKIEERKGVEREAKGRVAVVVDDLTAKRNEWAVLKGREDAVRAEVAKHEALVGGGVSVCPTCGQAVDPATLQTLIAQGRAQLEGLAGEARGAKTAHDTANEEVVKLQKYAAMLQYEIRGLEEEHGDLEQYEQLGDGLRLRGEKIAAEIRAALSALSLQVDAEDPELELKIASQLPVQPQELEEKKRALAGKRAMLASKIREQSETEAKLKRAVEILKAVKERMERAAVAKSLANGFEQAITTRRREVLRKLEHKALDYYKAMTDQHVYSAIKIDPETYEISVHPKDLTEDIPATRVGGGHQTIIALAARLALLDSLSFRSLLILDEPTYGIDSTNLPQLESQLGEASRQLSQMILVTHYGICEEEASNIIEVTVNPDGGSQAKPAL